ncbi:hypothetical protein BC629DRAFT_1445594 [Irpex lacteus]|nr:hypothetical protein BC629DRAFT_1445594 [Irpex lacteus]
MGVYINEDARQLSEAVILVQLTPFSTPANSRLPSKLAFKLLPLDLSFLPEIKKQQGTSRAVDGAELGLAMRNAREQSHFSCQPASCVSTPPPTEVRSRAPEFYGFVAWSSTYLLYCFFLLWALLPTPTSFGSGSLGTLAGKEWALLLPAYTVVLVLLTYCAYLALALSGTPSFSDVSTVTGMVNRVIYAHLARVATLLLLHQETAVRKGG